MFFYLAKILGFFAIPSNLVILIGLGGVLLLRSRFRRTGWRLMASIVVTLGPIPLGLGSFEAVSIGMLRLMGVPFEGALSATLLLRGFTLWMPLIAGFFSTRRELKRS